MDLSDVMQIDVIISQDENLQLQANQMLAVMDHEIIMTQILLYLSHHEILTGRLLKMITCGDEHEMMKQIDMD
jgi:hypothetical protein